MNKIRERLAMKKKHVPVAEGAYINDVEKLLEVLDAQEKQIDKLQKQRDGYRFDYESVSEHGYDVLKEMDARHLELLKTIRKARNKRIKNRRRKARKIYANFKALGKKLGEKDKQIAAGVEIVRVLSDPDALDEHTEKQAREWAVAWLKEVADG